MHLFQKRLLLSLLFSVWLLSACSNGGLKPPRLQLRVLRQIVLDSLPAGSALSLRGDSVYIISDDAPAYYRLPRSLDPAGLRRIPLPRPDSGTYELPKPLKPDYEASLALSLDGVPLLIAFGSGSLSPQRDSLLLLIGDSARTVPAGRLYSHFRESCSIPAKDFNLEAAAVGLDWLYFGNRGSNTLLRVSRQAFLQWLDRPQNAALPAVTSYKLSLPTVGGRLTGLSGLGELPEGQLLFCASAEATDNSYDDGAVLGSIVGIVQLGSDGAPLWQAAAVLQGSDGRPLPQKLESVVLAAQPEKRVWRLFAIADNDDGSSTLFELELKF